MPERGEAIFVVDVSALVDADLPSVEALARLQLAARRTGRTIELRHASPALCELVELAGLDAVIPVRPELPIEREGQAEHREEPRLQVVRDRGDPAG